MIRRALLSALSSALVLAACAGSTTTSSPTIGSPVIGGPGDPNSYFSIQEIGLGPSGYVTLLNYTGVSANLGTVYVCQPSGCVHLPDITVRPGDLARVAVGDGAGLEAVVVSNASLDLEPSDGEVGLYVSDDRRDPTAMRSYVQWGSTPHELTDVAVEAALWLPTAFAPTASHATRLWKTEGGLWVWDPG